MSSHLKTNLVSPANGTTTTLGESGDTIQLGTGATAVGFGEGGVPSDVKTFVNSGTWTKPAGCVAVLVEVQGAGGGGRSTGLDYVRGAGGGYAKKLIDVSSISSATITVGAGGASVAANGGNGNAGGDSIWSDGTNTVTGGGASAHGTVGSIAAAGGVASGGDLNINGQSSGKWSTPMAGYSFLGFVDPFNGEEANVEPIAGYGGGGGHGYTNYPSRAGGDGVVIVTEYSGTSGSSGGGGSSAESPVKAWVNFNGTGTVAIRDSMNVSSITDLGVGYYQVNFTIAMSNTDYAANMSVCPVGTSITNLLRTSIFANPNGSSNSSIPQYEAPTVNGFTVVSTLNTMDQRQDPEAVCIMVTA